MTSRIPAWAARQPRTPSPRPTPAFPHLRPLLSLNPTFPPPTPTPQLPTAFHPPPQVVAGKRGESVVRFGAATFLAQQRQLWASLPGPGAYDVEVSHVVEVPGGMRLQLEGRPVPLVLRLVEEEVVLRVQVGVVVVAVGTVEVVGMLPVETTDVV